MKGWIVCSVFLVCISRLWSCGYGETVESNTSLGKISEYPNEGLRYPQAIIGVGDTLWVTYNSGLASVDSDGKYSLYTLTQSTPPNPWGVAYGPNKSFWVTFSWGYPNGQLDFITETSLEGRVEARYQIPSPRAMPETIIAGEHNDVWFTEYGSDKIGHMTSDGRLMEFPLRTLASRNLHEHSAGPTSLTVGPDQAIWFTEFLSDKIGRLSLDGTIREYSLRAHSGPYSIVAGPDGRLWFTEYWGDRIGSLTTGGKLREFSLRESNARPNGIAIGPSGAIWFTETLGKIGRLDQAGNISTASVPGYAPSQITYGPDAAMWFIEGRASKTGAGDWGAVCKISVK